MAGVLAFAPVAQADDFFFSLNGGNWSDPNNWTTATGPMGVPTAGDDATFGGNNLTYTVTTSGNFIQNVDVDTADLTFNLGGNLTISNALTPDVSGFIRVTGTGTLSANSISADQFTIGNGTTVTTSSLAVQNLILTGGTLNSGNFQRGSVQISQGSTVMSTTVTLSNDFGASTLDASSWDATGLFKVNNAFSLTIKNGGTLTSGSAETDNAGGVTVDGASASWKITNDAAIKSTPGTTGAGLDAEHGGLATVGGNLTVSNGGTVFANFYATTGASEVDVTGKVDVSAAAQVYVGQGATLTSAGVVTRSSPFDGGSIPNGGILTIGGTWTNTGSFVIGESGSSASNAANDLQLLTGGTLTTTADLIVGQGAAFSTFEVGNNASVKNVNGVLAQNGGSRTDAFVGSFGGTNSKWTNSGTLTVADAGVGNLTIDGGGTVTDTAATVGNQAGSTGFVSVMNGGLWTVNGNLLIGAAAMSQGTVAVGFGGQLTVTGSTLTLGRDAGSVGSLNIDNGFAKGTKFNFTGALQVGLAGTGTLQILDGFVLDQSTQSLVLGGQATANGTLRVSDDTAKQFHSPTQTTYKSNNLTVGSLGSGTLTIANNGFVQTTGQAIVAEMAGANGMATITDTGSLWQVDGNLIVGDSGSDTNRATGSVAVANGGALKVNGAQFVLGQETGSQGTLVVDGSKSTVTGTGATNLEIGRHGIGTLQLQNGAQFTVASTTLGVQSDGAGQISVMGMGTSLTVNGALTVGGASPGVAAGLSPSDPASLGGQMTIGGGGKVTLGLGSGGGLIVGRDAKSTGSVDLSGLKSILQVNGTGSVLVGQDGTGTFNISGGAKFTVPSLILGLDANSSGTLTVTGSGGTNDSTLSVTSFLAVGSAGTGKVTLQNGATLDNAQLTAFVGTKSGGSGNVTVDGQGSALHISSIYLGFGGGDGQMQITNGAEATFDKSIFVGSGYATGSLEVGAAAIVTAQNIDLENGSTAKAALSILSGGHVTLTGTSSPFQVGHTGGGAVGAFPTLSVAGSGTISAAGTDTEVDGWASITGGAAASFKDLKITSSDGQAKVDVGGDPSTATTLTVSGSLTVGTPGEAGTLNIAEGGVVTLSGPSLNMFAGALMVSGSGAKLTVSESSVPISIFGGNMTVSGGGVLNNAAGSLSLAAGKVSVADPGSQLNVGTFSVAGGSLVTDAGGLVSIAHSLSINAGATVDVSAGGSVDIGTVTGPLNGTVLVGFGGTLVLNGSVFGDVITQLGGTVSGTGTIDGKVILANAGTQTAGVSGDTSTLTQNAAAGTTLILTGNNTYAGATTINGGTLQVGNGTSGNITASSGVAVNNGSALVTNLATGATFAPAISLNGTTTTFKAIQTGTNTLGGAITGAGVFNQNGTGTTILAATDSYTGATTVNAGTLQIGNGTGGNLTGTSVITILGTSSLAVDLADGATFAENVSLGATGTAFKGLAAGTNTVSGIISGTGTFAQNGTGTTILNVVETYTGITNVNAGTLQVDGSLAAVSTVNVATGGTLGGMGTIPGKVTLTGNGTIHFALGGTIGGTLAVTGGNWTGLGKVTGAITSTLGIFTIGGTLTAPAGLAISGGTLVGAGNLAGNLNYTSSLSSTFGGVISGASTVTMNKASSTLTLTGANTYTGATTISGGTLQLGDGTTAGATLGTGSVTVSGTGALALDLADGETFSKNVTVSAATATVKAIQAGTTTISGVISGLGGLTQSGTGTTILTTAQTYTGATTVTAGRLQVDNSLAAASSTVNVSAVGTLSGIGTIPGTVNILAGGSISPGDPSGPGTLTVGKLVLNAGSNSDFRLAAPGIGNGDSVAVTGNLTLAGNLNITQLTGFGIGSYTLFNYGGTLTNTGFTAINGVGGNAISISTGTAHQVNLIVSGTAITQYWDGTGAANNSVITGGSGTWNNTTSNWTTSTGATNSAWLGGTAAFETTGGTVMLGAPINVQGLIFGVTGYTLSGTSTLNLVGTPTTAPTVSVSTAGTTATISAPVTGISGLAANGAGTLILSNAANTYTGKTNITNGFVQIGTTAAAGSIGGGTISVASGGTLTVVNAHNNLLANNITNGVATTGTLVVNSTLANTLSGALTDGGSGSLALTQGGTGTTILTNASNSFSGATTISKGILQIGTATVTGSLGSITSVSVGAASTFSLVNVAGNLLTNNISDGAAGTGLVSINSTGNFTLSGTLSNGTGTLALTKAGTGTTTLTGTDSYTGATTVSAGTLQIGDGTNGNLTGTTAVTVSGTATLATDLGTGLTFNRNVNLSAAGANIKAIETGMNIVSGVISGTGVVNQSGPGTTILSGTNTYTGATNVTTGTLDVTGSLAAGSTVNVAAGGTLGGTGVIHGKATLAGSGAIDFGTGGTIAGTLTVTGGNWNGVGTVTGLVTSSSGTFTLGTGENLTATAGLALTGGTLAGSGTLTGSLNDTSATSMTFGGIIAGPASTITMNKAGSTLTLIGANTNGSATTVTAGTLQVGNGTTTGATTGSNTVNVASAGTLTTDLASGESFGNGVVDNGHVIATGTANNYTVSGIVSGTGNFTKIGTNTVTVTGANTYKGGTAVSAGTLLVNNTTGSGTGSGVVTVNNTATLGGSGTIVGALTLNNGGIIAPGAGTPGTAGTTLRATSLMWNGGGTLQLQLGSTGDELVLTGALTKGTAGTYTLDLTDATITQTTYTLVTFASTTFAQANFTLELPVGDTGTLVETSTSLMLTMLSVEEPAGGGTPTPPVPEIPGDAFSSFSPSTDNVSSSDLSLTPTPEPTSAALLAFGGAALLGWRRRRG